MVVAVAAAGCSSGRSPAPSRQQIEAFVGAPLPAGMADLHVHDESGIDRLMLLRFDAPADEARVFARKLVANGFEPGIDPSLSTFGKDLDWWGSVPAGREGESGEATVPGTRSTRVVVVPLPNATSRVWVASFTM